jgi:hypothetical protein
MILPLRHYSFKCVNPVGKRVELMVLQDASDCLILSWGINYTWTVNDNVLNLNGIFIGAPKALYEEHRPVLEPVFIYEKSAQIASEHLLL